MTEPGLAELLAPLLATLSHKQRAVLELRFGLPPNGGAYTREEVARIFRVTAGRVRSLEGKALEKLRAGARSHPATPGLLALLAGREAPR